jgi:hypothetical protein
MTREGLVFGGELVFVSSMSQREASTRFLGGLPFLQDFAS